MDRREDEHSTLLTLKETNQQIRIQDGNHYGLLSVTDDGDMTYIPHKIRKKEDETFILRQDKITQEPYFVNETIGNDIKIDRFINPITVDVYEATDALLDATEKQLLDL